MHFSNNPLDFRPNTSLIGLENQEERLLNHIQKGEISFLQGFTGSGKTSLLHSVKRRLKDRYEFIYLNAEDLPRDFDLDKEVRKKRNFFDKITFKKYPSKQPVLLIDEFQATDTNIVLEAKGKWEKPQFGVHAVVIAQIERELNNASGSFKERLGKRIIPLPTLADHEMKEILRSRLHNPKTKENYYNKLHPDAVNLLVKTANTNPRRLLEFADMVFDYHHKKFRDLNPVLKESYQVSYYAVKEILTTSSAFDEHIALPSMDSFTKEERKVLRSLEKLDVGSSSDVAAKTKIPQKSIPGILGSLRRKGCIHRVGKKNRRTLWELTEGMKRQLIRT